jgi:hypothetical protein
MKLRRSRVKRLLTSLAICATLSSCGVLDKAIDHGVSGGKELVDHITEKIGEAKTEALQETQEAISDLKTEILQEVEEAVDRVVPRTIDTILDADAVAFLIVSVTFLLGLVVIVALVLLLGTARSWWKRLRSA